MTIHLKTQKEQLAERLINMKPNVTKKDREAVHEATGLSFSAISTYLNGAVRDLDTATTLICEFEKLIVLRANKANIIQLLPSVTMAG